jgi:LAO/AO transport system kinase
VSSSAPEPEELASALRAGDTRALARAISLVERGDPAALDLLDRLRGAGRAFAVGLVGPPGVGKSTLAAALVTEARARQLRVGVLAVDPSSPLSGGALLGDRIRLADHFLDDGVFIRSSASRGHAGGLAATTGASLRLLGAAGTQVAFVETVGGGQGEIGIGTVADMVVLVLMPGAGDAVQGLKAGVMEIPDLIVVNKRDLPGAAAAAHALRRVLALGPGDPPAVVLSDARTREGTAEVWERIERRRGADDLVERRADRLAGEVLAVASTRMRRYLENALSTDPGLASVLEEVRSGRLEPLRAVEQVMRKALPIDDEDDPHTG